MTPDEFSNEFDILYNNIMSNKAPGLNVYEKSVFLTIAQDQIVKHYLNPKSNKVQEGFDGSIKRQVDFSSLIQVAILEESSYTEKLDPRSKVFLLPEEFFIPINETLELVQTSISGNTVLDILVVMPISNEEYNALMQKPYPFPHKRTALRLFSTRADQDVPHVEIIGKFDKSPGKKYQYKLRFLRKLKPIILEDLDSPVGGTPITIGGYSEQEPCHLPEELHREILQRAVELAKAAYIGDLNTQIALGQASQTEIGYLQNTR